MDDTTGDNPEARPALRKDAARNLERLIQAGREVFAARGLEATLNDVARHAGLGVGTAYRRFSNKGELIDAILVRQVDEMEQMLHDALAAEDAWDGLVTYLERSLAVQTRDRGLAQLFSGRHIGSHRYDWERDRLAPLVDQIAERACAQGVVRPGIVGTDLILIQIGVLGIANTLSAGETSTGPDEVTDGYRRYLAIALAGIRAGDGAPALPGPAPTTEQLHRLLARSPDPRGGHSAASGFRAPVMGLSADHPEVSARAFDGDRA